MSHVWCGGRESSRHAAHVIETCCSLIYLKKKQTFDGFYVTIARVQIPIKCYKECILKFQFDWMTESMVDMVNMVHLVHLVVQHKNGICYDRIRHATAK